MKRLVAALLLLQSTVASAQTFRPSATASPSFQRLVLDEPRPGAITIVHHADQLILTSAGKIDVGSLKRRSLLKLDPSSRPGRLVISIGPGASFRQYHQGANRIIDVFAAIPVEPSASADESIATTADGTQSLIPGLPPELSAKVDNLRPALNRQGSPPAPPSRSFDRTARGNINSQSQTRADGAAAAQPATPPSIAASAMTTPGEARTILLPFSAEVGVAAVRRRACVVLFFDEPRPIDLSAFQSDPVFAQARVLMQVNNTQIVLPLSADQPISLSHRPEGWLLALANPVGMTTVRIDAARTELRFLMPHAGKALTVTDPFSGATLLLGTDRAAGSVLTPARRSAAFLAEHSEVGIVVQPLSDRLSLRPIKGGFALSRDDGGNLAFPIRSLSPPASGVTASDVTRSFDFETGTDKELLVRLDRQLLAAAQAPPQARLGPRLAAAGTMVALGMEREAQTLLSVTSADDPTAHSNPTARWLQAVADTLVDPDHVDAFDDPSRPATEELEFWRALTASRTRPLTEADLSAIRRGLPLLLSYPDHLRDRAAALAAPLLLAGATAEDLDALARLPVTARTEVPQASALALRGRPADALNRLDFLTKNHDLKTSSDAVMAASLLRAKLQRIDAARAADTLAMHRLDWRATGQEGFAIMQEADLRRQSGQITKAFQLWREAERRFPDIASRARSNIIDSLDRLSDPKVAANMTPADFVRVIADCARELASRDGTEAKLAPILADRLEALDLPARATNVLREILNASASGVTKAEVGAKLASLLLEQDDLTGARDALEGSRAPGLPPALEHERRLMVAQIAERQGDHASALAALGDDDSPDAWSSRAATYASAGRWHDAKQALQTLAAKLPAEGMFSRKQGEVVLRLATAASRDGDTELLLAVARKADRLADPDQQQTLGLMVAPLAPAPAPRASAG